MLRSSTAILLACALMPMAWGQAGTTTEEEEEARQETVIVTGRAQALYRVGESRTGKLPTDPLNSTQIITTINADLIRDQGARDAQDIYRNIAGVSLFSYAGVTARGFRQEEIFFDGLRGDPYVGFSVPQLFNVERVDFLKGPAGMLYGQGAPGGLFNYVTKKPDQEFSANLRGIVGTEERIGVSGEITGALPMDGTAGRAGIFYEDRETPRFNTASSTRIYDAGISFELPFADLILQATRYEQDLDGNRLRGVPVNDNGNFLTDRRWNHNEVSDFLDLESTNLQAILQGDIGTELTWDATVRYTDASQEQEYHEPRLLVDSDGDGAIDLVGREFRDQLREEEQVTFGANLTWSRDFGLVDNRLLVGVEYFEEDFTGIFFTTRLSQDFITRFLTGTSLPTDIIPLFLDGSNYGATQPLNYDRGAPRDASSSVDSTGIYLLNEATIGQFTLIGGVRHDDNSNDEDTNTSFRVGGIYKPQDNISLFAQYADSYTPQGSPNQQVLESGGPFEPVTGTIAEGGIKAELFDGRVQGSISVYQIVRDNIIQDTGNAIDPVNDPFGLTLLAPVGEVTSDGLEIEFFADLTPNWVLTAAYAYNDTRITEVLNTGGNRGFTNSVGDRFANAPENTFGFWTRYQVPAINTAFAFGGDHVGERLSLSGQTVKAYTTFDASVIWETDEYNVLLRVDNLLDEEYAESGFLSRTGHFPGDPRSLFVEVSRTW
ncbi:MAG: TonB-dependent receptor [Pseudomonadota bacterium]